MSDLKPFGRMNEILEQKRSEVEALKRSGLPLQDDGDMPSSRDFKAAISRPDRICLIAEIKFASPSAGMIRKPEDPCLVGHIYEEAGAAAISLITDNVFFGGSLAELPRLKKAVSLPILRKDFIIDPIQVRQSLVYGADAILLIARILSRERLSELLGLSVQLGLAPLVEVHDLDDLEKAIDCRAEIIGINNRNLDTFEVDLRTTGALVPLVPEGCILVAESGFSSPEQIRSLRGSPVRAVLAGTSIMRSDHTEEKVKELVEAGR